MQCRVRVVCAGLLAPMACLLAACGPWLGTGWDMEVRLENDTSSTLTVRRLDIDTGKRRTLRPGETYVIRDRPGKHDRVLGPLVRVPESATAAASADPPFEVGVFGPDGRLAGSLVMVLPPPPDAFAVRLCLSAASQPPRAIDPARAPVTAPCPGR